MKSAKLPVILFLFCTCDASAQILDGYTDKLSYRAGETVFFFINAEGLYHNIDLGLYSLSNPESSVLTINFSQINQQSPTTAEPWKDGYGYSASATTWTVPSTLPSGYYLLENRIPIIIKNASYPSSADIVIILPTNTYYAYNDLPNGNSLYTHGNTVVSFLRPDKRIDDNGHHDDGLIKWISAWAPANNHTLSFISDMDMDDYREIQNARLLIVPGHSEYWTRQARLNFDQFVDEGKDALILSGNTMWWQVRYENTNGNTQLICYRGSAWINNNYSYDDDPIVATDPLLATYHWGEPSLKYSILGSIGSESLHGGFGVDVGNSGSCYGGFNGDRIVLPQSPLLSGLGFSFHEILSFATDEYDGTLVKTDANDNALLNGYGDPELDVSALGFYRAELIGYDKTKPFYADPGNLNETAYCPFIVFQKTCTSGAIINVSSNEWCDDWGIGLNGTNPNGNPDCSQSAVPPDSRIPIITANMIDLMLLNQIQQLNGNNLFFTPLDPSPTFILKPSYTNVSYNACSTGSIIITPCGIYLDQGYKVDNGSTWNYSIRADLNNNNVTADIDQNCTNYNNGLRVAESSTNNIEEQNQESETDVGISPNPFSTEINIQNIPPGSEAVLFDAMGRKIWSEATMNEIEIVSDNFPGGIYLLQVKSKDGKIICSKKMVKQ